MKSIQTSPLHSDFAVQVHVAIQDIVDDPAAIAELKAIWQKSPVMIFRRQALDEAELVRFTEHFGKCETSGRKDIQSPYHEQIIYFSTLKYSDGRFVGGFAGGEDVDWHSDQTFQVRPATGAILYGTEVPRDGGDIYWADEYGAWQRLPQDIQQLIEGRNGTYRYAKRYALLNTLELQDKAKANAMLSLPDATHPLVLRHPHTGRKALYADPTTLIGIEGLSEEENARVLPILFEAGGHPSLAYRHKVHNGDLMMWDNGCTMHRRDPMKLDQPRLMKRTTFRLAAQDYCVPHA
ncbi:TauD/TfdA family dioxygenase [Hydrogenophaga taeniospiralis]|uniref:TauD/TfdA dioxygenase family protein n=1 Tax=Hydrogenophaga taeniospiralis TaxID=65656 RepID=UPI001CFBE999|nr:TauD/TfdA family dioxygenase [Hydrogenophaga taeniospiralis]MCB4365514.1 TauD/TfdA family dioxygenase [Hydrogenophaga taeniospiralis]